MKVRRRFPIFLNFALIVCLIGVSVYLFSCVNRLERNVRHLEQQNDSLRSSVSRLREEKKQLELINTCHQIENEVEQIRGLSAIDKIDYEVIEKSQLKSILNERFDEVYPGNKFDNMEQAFKIIGLVDTHIDLKDIIMRVYDEQVAAFYDYEAKKLFMVENSLHTKSIRDMFLAHELTHMLQDQHYNLIRMGIDDYSNDDRLMGLSSLLEGDATYCMNKFYLNNAGLNLFFDLAAGLFMELKQSEIDNAPSYIKESLLFPYMKGLVFATTIYELDNSQLLHDVFTDPPVSSEQIIHPEKYFAQRDDPDIPTLPDLSDLYREKSLVQLYHNTMGEFGINIWLKEEVPADRARRASEGWDGDRYVVFRHATNPDIHGYLMFTTWDSSDDASEFAETYRLFIEKKYKHHLGPISDTGELTADLPDGHKVRIICKDTFCSVVYVHSDLSGDINRLSASY